MRISKSTRMTFLSRWEIFRASDSPCISNVAHFVLGSHLRWGADLLSPIPRGGGSCVQQCDMVEFSVRGIRVALTLLVDGDAEIQTSGIKQVLNGGSLDLRFLRPVVRLPVLRLARVHPLRVPLTTTPK